MSGSGWDDLTEADLGWCDELDAALDVLSSDEEDAAAAAEGDAAAAPSCPPQPTLPPLLSEGKTIAGPWQCQACTFINIHSTFLTCAACSTLRTYKSRENHDGCLDCDDGGGGGGGGGSGGSAAPTAIRPLSTDGDDGSLRSSSLDQFGNRIPAAARTQRLENEDEDEDDDVGGDGGGEKARYAHHHHHHHLQPHHGHFTSREEADRDLAEAADRRHHERVALEQVLGLDFDGRDGNTWLITARAARGGGGSNSKYKRGGSTSTALLKFYVPALYPTSARPTVNIEHAPGGTSIHRSLLAAATSAIAEVTFGEDAIFRVRSLVYVGMRKRRRYWFPRVNPLNFSAFFFRLPQVTLTYAITMIHRVFYEWETTQVLAAVREMLIALEPTIAQYGGKKAALRRLEEHTQRQKQKQMQKQKGRDAKMEQETERQLQLKADLAAARGAPPPASAADAAAAAAAARTAEALPTMPPTAASTVADSHSQRRWLTIELAPVEVLLAIFQTLPLRTLLVASLACKHWRAAASISGQAKALVSRWLVNHVGYHGYHGADHLGYFGFYARLVAQRPRIAFVRWRENSSVARGSDNAYHSNAAVIDDSGQGDRGKDSNNSEEATQPPLLPAPAALNLVQESMVVCLQSTARPPFHAWRIPAPGVAQDAAAAAAGGTGASYWELQDFSRWDGEYRPVLAAPANPEQQIPHNAWIGWTEAPLLLGYDGRDLFGTRRHLLMPDGEVLLPWEDDPSCFYSYSQPHAPTWRECTPPPPPPPKAELHGDGGDADDDGGDGGASTETDVFDLKVVAVTIFQPSYVKR